MKWNEIASLNEGKTYRVNMDSIPDSSRADLNLLNDLFAKNGRSIRIVGGSVRDIVLGAAANDIDLATDARPEEMMEFLKDAGYHVIPTGLQHGTITVMGKKSKEGFEITTLRIDTEHDGRHASVEFTQDWAEDSNRRDFTYNALYMDLDGTVHDYTDGYNDLMVNKRTRFVGSADQRIKEDYLRILRWFRFFARFGHEPDADTTEAIRNNAPGLAQISGERIWKEVAKIVSGPNAESALQIMKDTNVSDIIGLPLSLISDFSVAKQATKNPVSLMAALARTHDDIDHFVNDWKWSNVEEKLARFIVDNKFESFNVSQAKNWLVDGMDSMHVFELARVKGFPEAAKQLNGWTIPKFPINGKDLMDRGFKPGPEFGKILNRIRNEWKKSNFTLTRDQLLKELE